MLKCLFTANIKSVTGVFSFYTKSFSIGTKKQQNDKFYGQLYFFHGKTNLCGVLIAFYGNVNAVG